MTGVGVGGIAVGVGAGAEARRPLGVAVVAGMTTSTLLTLVVVPVVYGMLDDLRVLLRRSRARQQQTHDARAAHTPKQG